MHSILRFFTDLNRKNATLLVGGVMVLGLVIITVFAPQIEPHDPTYMQSANQFIAPCAEYPLGTDNLGRCIFSRVIEGAHISLVTAVLVVLFSAVLGSAIGLVAGFAGGKVDGILMRLTDVFFRYLIPSVASKVIVMMSLDLGAVILFCSSLSFLGLGAQPPSPDWGAMISDGRDYLRFAPWMSFFPGLAIAISAVGFNLLGDGIRDLTDPRMREHAVME